jgi:bifunctional DNA-binding transcriptional regulator/antitoxin component of YhaV-PrlF toxin-antitoxin module
MKDENKPATDKMTFRVILEQDDKTTACGITIPFSVPEVFGTKARVPVRGTLNGFPFRSSIAPMGGCFILPVNRELREGAGVKAGDLVEVTLERDTEPRVMEPTPDLAEALKADPAAKDAWDKLSYTHKKEFVLAIEEAKKPETRRRRIAKAVEELLAKTK